VVVVGVVAAAVAVGGAVAVAAVVAVGCAVAVVVAAAVVAVVAGVGWAVVVATVGALSTNATTAAVGVSTACAASEFVLARRPQPPMVKPTERAASAVLAATRPLPGFLDRGRGLRSVMTHVSHQMPDRRPIE